VPLFPTTNRTWPEPVTNPGHRDGKPETRAV
jgi:hypothetical protein